MGDSLFRTIIKYVNEQFAKMFGYDNRRNSWENSPMIRFTLMTAETWQAMLRDDNEAKMRLWSQFRGIKKMETLDMLRPLGPRRSFGRMAIDRLHFDITERRACRRLELRRIRFAIESATDAIAMATAQGHRFYHHAACEQ